MAQENVEPVQQGSIASAPWKRGVRGQRLLALLRWDRRQAIATLVAFCTVLAALAIGLVFYASAHHSRIYEGVSVAGIDVGGMTRSQARSRLERDLNSYSSTPITFSGTDESYSIVPADAGLHFDIDATVARAFSFGRSDPLYERVARWSHALLHGSDVRPVYVVDTTALDSALSDIAQQIIIAPQDAYIQMSDDDQPAIVPEVNGLSFDLTATRSLVIQRFSTLSTDDVPMILPVVFPGVLAANLEGGLADAQGAVAEAFLVQGPDGRAWRITTSDLRAIVSFSASDGELRVNEGALKELVASLASSVDRDPVDAAVYVNDDDEIVVRSAVNAREVDQSKSVKAIEAAITDGDRNVALVIESTPADIDTDAAQAAAIEAEALVSSGLKLTWTGGSAELTRRELLAALTISVDPSADDPYTFGLDEGVLTSVLTPLFDSISVPATEAKLRLVDGEIKVIEKSKSGKVVDVDKSIDGIIRAALDETPTAPVVIVKQDPEYTEKDAKNIKLPDTLATASTFYGTSSDQRRQNVERAAELEDGWLVAPGETFSFVEQVGGISEKEGFAVGFGIVSNGAGGVTTAPVVGGGVCQVSTTLFQAVFWSGLQVTERYTHPYWINSYGEPPSGRLGLDAMVDVQPDYALDFKFTNTTGDWIAVVFDADGTNVIVKIMGTNPRWTIEVDDPAITDVQQPETDVQYEDSSELPAGQELQVESAAQGFTANIHRVVSLNGETLSDDVYSGVYAPSRNTILRGTGED